jgi:hypothetical protein
LRDTHWIGGDPSKLEVYGWASWTPQKGIITLRNPSDHSQEFLLDVAAAFELPTGAVRVYSAHSPWQREESTAPISLQSGAPHKFTLKPFQVLTLEATPIR